jgi:predicted nucleotide-binding protein
LVLKPEILLLFSERHRQLLPFGSQKRGNLKYQGENPVAKINQRLLERLEQKIGVSRVRIYQLIDSKVRSTHLPRPLAAIALASERGINISKYANEDDLAMIRNAALVNVPPPVHAPVVERKQVQKPKGAKRQAIKSVTQRRGNTVFVVHGRNLKAKTAVFTFLRSIGLKPLEWNQLIRKTAQPSPYVGAILETAFQEASAVVVLLTPDDQAKIKKKYLTPKDPSYERNLTGQARPNVLFEAGMAFGRNPNSTILVQLGQVKPFSDVVGRHVVYLSNDPTSRQEFATKLANAGCNVDTSGTDWLTTGDFSEK